MNAELKDRVPCQLGRLAKTVWGGDESRIWDGVLAERVAAARTALELAGDIGKHSQANQGMDQPLCEMSPEQLSALIGHWEEERAQVARDITPDA